MCLATGSAVACSTPVGSTHMSEPSLEFQRCLLAGLRQTNGRRDGLGRGLLPEPGELRGAQGSGISDLLEQVLACFGGEDPCFGLDRRWWATERSRSSAASLRSSGLVPNRVPN